MPSTSPGSSYRRRIARTAWWHFFAAIAVFSLTSCGGTQTPPERGVLETSLSPWEFRRYQQLLDIEVWVPDNKGMGYTASYVRKQADRAGQIDGDDVASAFVTRYETERGVLRALVEFVRRLQQEGGYEVEVQSLGDVQVLAVTGHGEAWALWASGPHVVKVGGRGLDSAPVALVEGYGARYPSRITGDLLDRPLPPVDAPPAGAGEDGDEAYDPNNPTPDWKAYESDDGKGTRKKAARKSKKASRKASKKASKKSE